VAYGKPIRMLHSLLASCVIAQLAIGELMDVPGQHDSPIAATGLVTPAYAHAGHHAGSMPAIGETPGFIVHGWLGMFIAGLLLMRLFLSFSAIPGANWRDLLPWLSGAGRKMLLDDAKSQAGDWMRGRLPPLDEGKTVARAVHGLMLLTALAIATAGVLLFFAWNAHGRQSEIILFVGETHETLVGLLEGLVGLHVLAVIIHQRMGHDCLSRIKPGGD